MASTNEIFGQIGAAKIFTGGVSNALGIQAHANEAKIQVLEQQLAESTDEKERKHLQKKIKRLKNANKRVAAVDKFNGGATKFLTDIAKYCDIGKKELINWLANFITGFVPVLDVAVKMLLLTNIKKMVSCSLDPRIPDSWRTEGVFINESEIDPRHVLLSSPYSKWGRYNYFGVFDDDKDMIGKPLFSLARAEDMDAFLWFTKNSAKFTNPFCINNSFSESNTLSRYFDVAPDATLYNTNYADEKEGFKFLEGCTFKQTPDANTLFLIEGLDVDKNTQKTTYTIFPVSNTWTSVNWYKNRKNAAKQKPLFSLEYSNAYNPNAPLPRNNFRFKILPKPFKMAGGFVTNLGNNINVLADAVENPIVELIGGNDVQGVTKSTLKDLQWPGFASMVPHVARFNEHGEYDKRGKYSIYEDKFTVRLVASHDKDEIQYELLPKSATSQQERASVKYLAFNRKDKKFYLRNKNGGKLNQNEIASVITECYFGKTVYEFNYDYIMSFKLFDPKVISANIINGLMNIDLPKISRLFRKGKGNSDKNTISNRDQAFIDAYVDKLVEKLIETEDEEFTDCFYNFSNQEYVDLENEVNSKIINGAIASNELESENDIQAVYDILDAYDADSSLEEQTEIITRSITKAIELSEPPGDDDSDNGGGTAGTSSMGGSDFITKVIQMLMSSIVNSILSPKVMMLLQINQKLMNNSTLADIAGNAPNLNGQDLANLGTNYIYKPQDVLNGLSGLLSGIIKEIISTIQKELLRIILARINEIMSAYLKQLALEYAQKWVNLIKQLLACFKFKKNKASGGNDELTDAINGALAKVDYADIDALAGEIMPNTKDC